ncbi:MAG: hypothetical protein COW11_06075 [Candidatus Omnitrophica bacterium CG12_big_fil_rev_8_21_14_0_65_43_15]|uniref:Lipoprotein n=1 Tax=Candidatus Taenaricola geysiri TaxID=1974752 RepID=A0A2J0LIP0_9BACT|nr:MAG: hypothetical protein COU52_01295 [Candidatus Omnitrophica bacterium CG10_big_fil_rev_8_21_14_0_10_43_8]PIW65900.1 MAG: hypothetical protein COW11_06075 [Candidatus Omnitrophica bacterium CG12_big_fil_rev_8_21_14_0_65_43_15]PIW80668.1 MAG: hypothetical protein COZ98_01095 [Candidatus Omnitrophica bacterium CG_4_8_14_3_um_filter_43_15]PIY83599.1 MAG: hypothetical protein COY77_05095 [Candidatus Omnitrophica bacterium CG_4_10_14_0_8_um_filter_43_18]PJC45948.1 MAG: hypothetical protein CO03
MKKNNTRVSIILILGLIFIATGCATTSNSNSSSSMQAGSISVASILKFEDVPVPSGFKLVDNESFTFQNDNMRVGLLKYTGRPDANVVVNFYKEQMPMYNWDMLNVIEYGQKIMNFQRADQTCIITIQPLSTRTLIAIAVAPKSSSTMTEAKTQKYKELKESRIK